MHFAILGLVIGLASGFSPGPLQTLVLSQSARFGWRAGAATALAPLISDTVIVALTVGIIGLVPRIVLHLISIAGALLVGYLAVDTWKASKDVSKEAQVAEVSVSGSPRTVPSAPPAAAPPNGSFVWRATLVNFLNPHPWLFWAIVGAPLTIRAGTSHFVYGILFVGAFYCALVGTKIALAVLVARGVQWLGSGFQKWVVRASSAGLAVVAVILLVNGAAGL